MKSLKTYALAVLFLALSLLLTFAYAQNQPRAFRKIINLLPSQSFDFVNDDFRIVEVRSQFPVFILAGECESDSTVQFRCEFDKPRDVFIQDLRMQPLLRQPESNTVTILAREW